MNYFVEGLQGSGKSTLAKKVSEKHTECKHLEEGDYSPIELSWCAYLSKEEYERVLNDYPEMNSEITVAGVFDTYMEGEYMYCTLKNARFVQ